MTLKHRLAQLEKQKDGNTPEIIILYIDGGMVTEADNQHPELTGKTEAEIDTLFAARTDIQLLKIVYASQYEQATQPH